MRVTYVALDRHFPFHLVKLIGYVPRESDFGGLIRCLLQSNIPKEQNMSLPLGATVGLDIGYGHVKVV